MDVISVQKYLITSPRKLREVASLIKGLSPQDAVEQLPFIGKRGATPLRKAILTAIANAKQKGVDTSTIVFKEIQVTEGPRLKRFRAGARGRAKPYKRRMSHIRVVLTTKEVKETLKQKPTKVVKTKETIQSLKTKKIRKETKK